jgi:hypothetical protein
MIGAITQLLRSTDLSSSGPGKVSVSQRPPTSEPEFSAIFAAPQSSSTPPDAPTQR